MRHPTASVNKETETISLGASDTAESMPDRRTGKPSIPDEMAVVFWDHVQSVHRGFGGVIARTARHYRTSTTSIGKWLARTTKPSFGVLIDVAKIDGLPVDVLLFGHDRARPLIDVIDAVFRTTPAVSQTDPIARRKNISSLMEAVQRLGGDPDEHEGALAICKALLEAGRVDNVDGWALLLARIEELDIAPALLTSDSDLTWHTGIDFARQRPPPDRLPDEVTEPAAKPVAELRVSRNTVSVGGARKKTR